MSASRAPELVSRSVFERAPERRAGLPSEIYRLVLTSRASRRALPMYGLARWPVVSDASAEAVDGRGRRPPRRAALLGHGVEIGRDEIPVAAGAKEPTAAVGGRRALAFLVCRSLVCRSLGQSDQALPQELVE